MKRVFAREEVCMGCRLCEVACIVEHSQSKRILKVFKEEIPRPLKRTNVEEDGAVSFSLQCRHCEDPPCVEACITGAMHKVKETGTVLVDEKKCVGCWMCIMNCPFGVIRRNEGAGKKISSKCDLCPDRETPACVDACPNRALLFEERE